MTEDYWGIIGVLLFFIALFGVSYFWDQKRQRKFREIANRLQLNYKNKHTRLEGKPFPPQSSMQINCHADCSKILSGNHSGYNVLVYEVSLGDSDTYSYFTIELPKPMPKLKIGLENFFTNIAKKAGFSDINFESKQFSEIFNVRSESRKFAYDFCNNQMMCFLLANQDFALQVDRHSLTMIFKTSLESDYVEFNLERLVEIRELMPQYLFAVIE